MLSCNFLIALEPPLSGGLVDAGLWRSTLRKNTIEILKRRCKKQRAGHVGVESPQALFDLI